MQVPIPLAALLLAALLHAKECIVARWPEQVMPGANQSELPSNQRGYPRPHHFHFTLGERHQFSSLRYTGTCTSSNAPPIDPDARIVTRIMGKARDEDICKAVDWLTHNRNGDRSGSRSGSPPPALVKRL